MLVVDENMRVYAQQLSYRLRVPQDSPGVIL